METVKFDGCILTYEREGVEWRGMERVMQGELAYYG